VNEYLASSPASIESYGKRLIGGTLRSVRGVKRIPEKYSETSQGIRTKGSFGMLLERFYYGITPPNESAPDFSKAKVELKSTPLKLLRSGRLSAKERLVLNIINYNNESKRDFDTSTFLKKNEQMMLVAYLHDNKKLVVDYIIKLAELVTLSKLSREDQAIIRQDWQKIIDKIRAGKADELSESDTLYLGACTKAADSKARRSAPGGISAKPRAFSFKAGFMTTLMRARMEDAEPIIKNAANLKEKNFEAFVEEKFQPFLGLSVEEIRKKVGEDLNPKSKDFFAALARRIMGVKKKRVEEFEKAEVVMKTIRVGANGMPREAMSFPAFSYLDIIHEKWDESDKGSGIPSPIKTAFDKKFFFVVFQCGKNPKDVKKVWLKKVLFWNMPANDLAEVKKVWQETIKRINTRQADKLPGATENKVAHVRPHGRNGADKIRTPHNGTQVKKSFWFNMGYIRDQIS